MPKRLECRCEASKPIRPQPLSVQWDEWNYSSGMRPHCQFSEGNLCPRISLNIQISLGPPLSPTAQSNVTHFHHWKPGYEGWPVQTLHPLLLKILTKVTFLASMKFPLAQSFQNTYLMPRIKAVFPCTLSFHLRPLLILLSSIESAFTVPFGILHSCLILPNIHERFKTRNMMN